MIWRYAILYTFTNFDNVVRCTHLSHAHCDTVSLSSSFEFTGQTLIHTGLWLIISILDEWSNPYAHFNSCFFDVALIYIMFLLCVLSEYDQLWSFGLRLFTKYYNILAKCNVSLGFFNSLHFQPLPQPYSQVPVYILNPILVIPSVWLVDTSSR